MDCINILKICYEIHKTIMRYTLIQDRRTLTIEYKIVRFLQYILVMFLL